jgi:hypothetical protein
MKGEMDRPALEVTSALEALRVALPQGGDS